MYRNDKRYSRGAGRADEADLYLRRTDGHFNADVSNGFHSDINQKPLALHHRPRVPRKSFRTDLSTAFDPMKDRHMWTMWRTAVNGRIMDEVWRREQQARYEAPRNIYANHANGADNNFSIRPPHSYGDALSGAPPLSRFIRLDDQSKSIAHSLTREGQGQLKTSQFIYYGLPRVMISTSTPDLSDAHLYHYQRT